MKTITLPVWNAPNFRVQHFAKLALLLCALQSGGCTVLDRQRDAALSAASQPAGLSPVSAIHADLVGLPSPKGKIVAAVYGFRDQTGQYKPTPDSSFSTAVTQGAGSLLIKAMADSGWFTPVEREGLQNVLTERRIVRALEPPPANGAAGAGGGNLTGLLPASILLEGGIIGYETNVRTGGAGARFLGVGASEEYRTDQVTINLRAVDIRSGRILVSTSTTKGIYSYKLAADVFRYVSYQRLLEAEVGYTRNEPAQLCVQEAIETALVYLIAEGIRENHWALKDPEDINSPVIRHYLVERPESLHKVGAEPAKPGPAAQEKAQRAPVTEQKAPAPAAAVAIDLRTSPPLKMSTDDKSVTAKSDQAANAGSAPDTRSAVIAAVEKSPAASSDSTMSMTRSNGRYLLQLGVFSSAANAEKLHSRLLQNGITSQSEFREAAGPSDTRLERVTVGPFQSRQAVDEMRKKLVALGFDPGVILAVKN
jgi:curli production assembly/transport component CsgG